MMINRLLWLFCVPSFGLSVVCVKSSSFQVLVMVLANQLLVWLFCFNASWKNATELISVFGCLYINY